MPAAFLYLRALAPYALAALLASGCGGITPAPLEAGCTGTDGESHSSEKPSALSANAFGAASACATDEPAEWAVFRPVAAAHPTGSGEWVADAGDALTLYALGEPTWRSQDGGRSWCRLDWAGATLRLLFAKQPTRTLYRLIEGSGPDRGDRLVRSVDGGQTWTQTGTTPPGAEALTVIDGAERPVFLASSSAGSRITRSEDEGASWHSFDPRPEPHIISPDLGEILVAPGTIYIGARNVSAGNLLPTFLVSTDLGKSFVVRPSQRRSPEPRPRSYVVDCAGHLYEADGDQIYRSRDRALTWESFARLEPNVTLFALVPALGGSCVKSVHALGEAGADPTLWCFNHEGSVTSHPMPSLGSLALVAEEGLLLSDFGLRQRSDDGGRSWWVSGVSLELGDLVVSPARPDLLFVSSIWGIFRSDDGGRHWRKGAPRAAKRSFDRLYPHPRDPGILYASSFLADHDDPPPQARTPRGSEPGGHADVAPTPPASR